MYKLKNKVRVAKVKGQVENKGTGKNPQNYRFCAIILCMSLIWFTSLFLKTNLNDDFRDKVGKYD